MTDGIVDRLRDYAMLDGERLESLWHEIDRLRARVAEAERENEQLKIALLRAAGAVTISDLRDALRRESDRG